MSSKRETLNYRFFFDKKLSLVRHIVFWCIIYFTEIVNTFMNGYYKEDYYVVKLFSCIAFHILLTAINIKFILPKYFLKNKYGIFFIICFIQETIYTIYTWYIFQKDYDYFQTEGFWKYFIMFIVQNCIILGSAVGLKLFKLWYKNKERLKEILIEKYQTELQFLKNQINPHFLFNSLNNIMIMHQIKHEETENSILRLSNMLKYQLYDCSNEKVSLKKEIEYIHDYINLEKIRKQDLCLTFEIIENSSSNSIHIEPLILGTFIENSFKHARKVDNEYYINIYLTINHDSILFEIKNSKREINQKNEVGGIGNQNVRKRLELVYKNNFSLDIIDQSTEYSTILKINTN